MADEQGNPLNSPNSTANNAAPPRDERSAMIGRKLGDYELVEMMAAGGMARIFKGIDRRLERTAAVKVLMRELLDSDDSLTDRFSREARAIAKLEHENIVSVYQTGDEHGYYFMAMKFVEGKDLADELNDMRRRGKLMDIRRALRILGQVAAALDYAHTHGIIHRDIKPSNILLDKQDKAYLTDFGLALWQSKEKTMGTAFGTPRYISPEQALASEKSVPQSDIYSLAVVLYEILTGDMLFRADTPMQIALSHISEPPPAPRTINPSIPEGVEREVLKALAKDPTKRHRTASEFISAVAAAYGPMLDKAAGVTPPPLSISKTPVLTDDSKQMIEGVRAAAAAGSASSSSASASAPASRVNLDDQTAHVRALQERSPEFAKAARQAKGRSPLIPLLAVVVIVAMLGGAGLALLSGNNNPAAATSGNPTSSAGANTSAPTEATARPTPIPAGAADSPLLLSYDWSAVVFRNQGDERFTAQNLEIIWDGGSQAANAVDLSPAGCAIIYQTPRDFSAGAFGCTGNQKPTQVGQEKFFWRRTSVARFEVRLNGAVIGRCEAVARGDGIVECPLDWP